MAPAEAETEWPQAVVAALPMAAPSVQAWLPVAMPRAGTGAALVVQVEASLAERPAAGPVLEDASEPTSPAVETARWPA
jgi:hypothetical protein